MKLGNGVSAIVAGGATGLGAAAAEKLASKGCKVAILDMYREPGEALARKIGGIYCHLEISSEITVDTAFDFAREENGIERVLVNCAGVAIEQRAAWRDPQGRIHIHDVPSFERLLQVNLTGTFYMAVKAAQGMMSLPPLDNGMRGVIINSASVAAEDGLEGQAAYAASEGGVLALTRPLARDLVDDGVRVVTIMPGRYDTMMFTERSTDVRQMVGTTKQQPDGMSDPKEFAEMVVKLCEDDQYNGQVIRLSGAKG
ncbi:MAG: SDR family NAD(P)-dependent oxidoreductase [Hyphomicrobiales bacterium]|nr:SDR family NAD(P)-dependent oxidoreductase [Hyphomicrobiales bacterium]